MKKILVIVISVLLISVALLGCAGQTEESQGASDVPEATEDDTAQPDDGDVATDSEGDTAQPIDDDGFVLADHIQKKVENGEPLEIVAVHHDIALTFTQVIASGVSAAGEDLGIKAELTGTNVAHDVQGMVAMIEDLIVKEVDGIMVSNVNGEALNPVIDKAIAAGIPTITFGTNSPGSKSFAHIGQDTYLSGYTLGEVMAEYLGEEGKILINTCSVSAQWSVDRETGLRDAIANYPNMEIVGIIDTGTDDQGVYSSIENGLRANPDLAGLATLCAVTTPVAGRVITDMGKADAIVHVGNDLDPLTLENIKSGATEASLSQDPYRQGYDGVMLLYNFIMNNVTPESVDTGVLRVDETNVDEFLKKLDDGEPIG